MPNPLSAASHFCHQCALYAFEVLNLPLDLMESILRQHPPYWRDWQNRLKDPKFNLKAACDQWGDIFSEADARGRYLSTLVLNRVPATELQAMLPPGLEVRPDSNGTHPVVYAFGFMQNTIPDWVPLPGMNYLEMMVSIPNVYLAGNLPGYRGPFLYMPSLCLNHLYPCILGWLAGYNKHWSRVKTTEDTYRVTTLLSGHERLRAKFTREGKPGAPKKFPGFEPWKELANKPAVTRLFGKFMFVFFYWEWEHAIMQSVRAEIAMPPDQRYSVPGLQYGQWPGIGENQPIGALRIDVPFQWVPAFDRADLKVPPALTPAGPGGTP